MAGGGNVSGGSSGGSQPITQPNFSAPPDMSSFRPSMGDPQFYQPIYMPQYQSYSASPFSTFGVASYGTSPMMQQDIMSRGMQTTPYYSYGGGNLGMFGLPSFVTPFDMYARQQNQRRTTMPVPEDRRVVFGGDGDTGGRVGDYNRMMAGIPGMPTMPTSGGPLGGFGSGGPQLTSDALTPEGRQMMESGRAAVSPVNTFPGPSAEDYFGRGFGGRGGGGGFGGGFDSPFAAMPYFDQPTVQPNVRTPIVTRSAQARGTPNVMMRRAEGGITDLLKK